MSHQFVPHLATTVGEKKTHQKCSSNLAMGMIRDIPKITAFRFGLVIVIFHLVVRADKFSREGSHLPEEKEYYNQ